MSRLDATPVMPAREVAIIAAASQAASALAELLRYSREGEGLSGAFEEDVVEQLLEAAKLAIDIHGLDERYATIHQAIAIEIEGWVG